MIVYPVSLDTDFKKLCAVYSLLEQMRLEHNRQGAIARSDWKTYQGKWAKYAKIFKAKQLPILKEQNRLRDAIRKANYTDKAWMALSEEDRQAVFLSTYRDKEAFKVLPTSATSDLLSQLKVIDFSLLDGKFVDPIEDFTTYTEVDSDGDITITASKCDVVTMLRTALSYVRKDAGVGHFGDFEHLIRLDVTAVVAGTGVPAIVAWALTNGSNTFNQMDTVNNEGLSVYVWLDVNWYVALRDCFNDAEDSYSFTPFGDKWFAIARSSNTATCKIYSDAARTNLLDTLSITCQVTTYQYIYGLQSIERAGTSSITCFTENLDLQEAAGATPQAVGDGAITIGGTLGLLTKASYGGGAVAIAGNLGLVTKIAVGAGELASAAILGLKTLIETGSGALNSAGSLALKTALALGDGAVAIAGALARLPKLIVGMGSIAISGSLGRAIKVALGDGAIAIAGALARLPKIAVGSGVVTSAGSLALKIVISIGEGAVSIAGDLGRAIKISLGDGAIAIAGALARLPRLIVGRGEVAISGSLSIANIFTKLAVGMGAVLSASTLNRKTAIAVGAGELASAGALRLKTAISTGAGAVTSAASVAYMRVVSAGNGAINIVGLLSRSVTGALAEKRGGWPLVRFPRLFPHRPPFEGQSRSSPDSPDRPKNTGSKR